MVRAIWRDVVLAESEETRVVEGNHYFPPEAVRAEHLVPSERETLCPWKGVAGYFDVRVGGEVNRRAAWCYPHPTPAAAHIARHVAFWRGVRVVDDARAGGAPRLLARLLGR